jgi:hypothetical protein
LATAIDALPAATNAVAASNAEPNFMIFPLKSRFHAGDWNLRVRSSRV